MSASPIVGQTLSGRYRVDRLIGEGGMGAVYEGLHLQLRKRVAIKTLHAKLGGDPKFRARFLQEARATSKINHPNIIRVNDVDIHDNRILYFVLEYLEGEDLSETLAREHQLPWPRVQRIGLQLCDALSAAHAAKVIHRDLKPSNCFRMAREEDQEDLVKILDFGIAKLLENTSGRRLPNGSGEFTVVDRRRLRLTETGEIFGTMAYMSPEHCRGEEVDHRTDIYAVGVILYELLTGSTPFSVRNLVSFMRSLELDPPPAPSLSITLPADMEYAILKALEKRPEDRFANMLEFAAALGRIPRIHQDLPVAPQRPPPHEVLPAASVDSGALTWVRIPTPRGGSVASPSSRHVRWGSAVAILSILSLIIAGITVILFPPNTGSSPRPQEPRSPVDSPAHIAAPHLLTEGSTKVSSTRLSTQIGRAARPIAPSAAVDPPQPAEPIPSGSHAGTPQPHSSAKVPRTRSKRLRTCDFAPIDRYQMFSKHSQIAKELCKFGVPHNLPIIVSVRIVDGRLSATSQSKQTGKRREVARCIANYLKRYVRVPRYLDHCNTAAFPITY